jgi:pimeloyl-ACP methyl ester carboxylesterase
MRAVRKKSLILMPLAGVIIFICFYAKIENFFVFHPQKNHDMLPDQLGLAYESIFFEASDGTKLHGWFFPLPRKSPIILFCHGNRDEIIPFNMGENLFEAAPEPKAFYAIEGAGHNDTWLIGGSRYFETLKRFIQS